MTDNVPERTAEEQEAEAARNRAEAAKLEAERAHFEAMAAKARFEAAATELALERATFETQKAREIERDRQLTDDKQHVYRFTTGVGDKSVKDAVDKLTLWARRDPGCDIEIVFDSPGGNIIDGFHLFDLILSLRGQGHRVTTIGQGMAASMAGVLLQAGDVRVMTRQAALLIHEAQFMALGSYGEVKDEMEFVEKLQDRILEIFASRSKLTKQQIKNRWTRKNWWMLADEALTHGFIDEIR